MAATLRGEPPGAVLGDVSDDDRREAKHDKATGDEHLTEMIESKLAGESKRRQQEHDEDRRPDCDKHAGQRRRSERQADDQRLPQRRRTKPTERRKQRRRGQEHKQRIGIENSAQDVCVGFMQAAMAAGKANDGAMSQAMR